MCGIIGYVGKENALPKITEGLSVLEYRGYDSVGLAARMKSKTAIIKCKGRIEALKESLRYSDIHESNCSTRRPFRCERSPTPIWKNGYSPQRNN